MSTVGGAAATSTSSRRRRPAESTFTLGWIAGVKIGRNWSWAIVSALIAWSLASTVFPEQDPFSLPPDHLDLHGL